MMSPGLQSKLVLDVNHRWLRSVWFLAGVETEFVVRLTLSLSPMVLAPYELAPSGFLYILCRGVIILSGELLVKGATWGEDIILGSCTPSLIRLFNAKAMNYVEVFLCSWPALETALESFPVSAAHVHRCAVRLAMRRHFVLAARQARLRMVDGRNDTGGQHPRASTNLSHHGSANCIGSFKRAKTLHGMLAKSTKARGAEVTLSTQLINLRRSVSGLTDSSLGGSTSNVASSSHSATDHGPEGNSLAVGVLGWSRASRAGAPKGADELVTGTAPSSAPSTPDISGGQSGVAVQMAVLKQLELLTHAIQSHGTILDHIVDELPQLRAAKARSVAGLDA